MTNIMDVEYKNGIFGPIYDQFVVNLNLQSNIC